MRLMAIASRSKKRDNNCNCGKITIKKAIKKRIRVLILKINLSSLRGITDFANQKKKQNIYTKNQAKNIVSDIPKGSNGEKFQLPVNNLILLLTKPF